MSYTVIIPSKSPYKARVAIHSIRKAHECCRIIVIRDFKRVPYGWSPPHDTAVATAQGVWDIYAEQPFVFARNVNLGIRAAGSDDVILMNDDCILHTKNGFATLSKVSRHHYENRGIVSPAIRGVVGKRWQEERPGLTQIEYCQSLSFPCVYIPRRVIDTHGLLDERYVDYGYEDDDYCVGRPCLVAHEVLVEHLHGQSDFRPPGRPGPNLEPNLRRFIEKWNFDPEGKSRECSPWKNLFPPIPETSEVPTNE